VEVTTQDSRGGSPSCRRARGFGGGSPGAEAIFTDFFQKYKMSIEKLYFFPRIPGNLIKFSRFPGNLKPGKKGNPRAVHS